MNYYTEEQQAFQQTIRDFFEREVNPHVDEWEKARIFPAHQVFKRCGELGMLGVSYDEKYGGAGLDYSWTAAYVEAMSESCLCNGIPMAIMVQTDMCTPALHDFGSEELKQRWLRPSIAGEAVGAIGVSEPARRLRRVLDPDRRAPRRRLLRHQRPQDLHHQRHPGRLHHHAGQDRRRTRGITDSASSSCPTDTPGFSVANKLEKVGNHCSDTAELLFEDVRVPVANRIGEEGMGFIYQMRQFQKERMVAALGAYAGGAEHARARPSSTCKERKVFGKPLALKQHVQFTLAELQTEIEMLRQLNYHCVRMIVAGEDCTRETSMAKLAAGRLVRNVADWCMQFHGGYGYMDEYYVSRYWRDSRLLSIGGGADEVMLQIIAKLEGYGAVDA